MPRNHSSSIALLALVVINLALFLPMIGRGFIHDDFGHLYSVAYQSLRYGLTHVTGGPFYAPVTWLSYRIDWLLWGMNAFPFAAINLLLHIINMLVLYWLARRLLGDHVAAWWSAFGFGLLFPANAWAVMIISTRAHLLATLFYLAALIAATWFARTSRQRQLAGIAIVVFAALSIFSKESGLTILAAVALIIFFEKQSTKQRFAAHDLVLFLSLLSLIAIYWLLRARAGAVPIAGNSDYGYVLSLRDLAKNAHEYGWRTYGLLTLMAIAIAASLRVRGLRPSLRSISRSDVWRAVLLFLVMIAPFALLRLRSGIYAYLPGTGAALLLGVVTRALYQRSSSEAPKRPWIVAVVPIILVVAFCLMFTVGHSRKFIRMAETNTKVLGQMASLQPAVKPNTFIVLTYTEIDRARRFPEGFGAWSFPDAVRLLYSDPTLDGRIVREGESYSTNGKSPTIRFGYVVDGNELRIVRVTDDSATR